MHAAFGTVLLVVCALSLVVAVLSLVWNRRTWEDYGNDGLTLESERSGPSAPESAAERESEIRELLEARNARRERRGAAPLDVEREVQREGEMLAEQGLGDARNGGGGFRVG